MDGPERSVLTAWAILGQTYSLLHKHLDRLMGQGGSSASLALALFALNQSGRPLPLSRLARMMVLEAQSVTGLADRLEQAGLIQRVPDSRDRRTINVVLTAAGTRVAEQLSAVALQALGEQFSVLRPEELDTLLGTLRRLRQHGAVVSRFPLVPFEVSGSEAVAGES